jgi:hypothetical protein
MRHLALVAVVLFAAALAGCARGGEGTTPVIPEAVLDVTVRMAAPVRDNLYYFVAINAGPDARTSFPVPVAAGPFWGNGWGTGAMTHFLEYHNGQYNLFSTNLSASLQAATGGFTGATGSVTAHAAGTLKLTVTAITPGAATVAGSGAISSATNASGQNAGVLSLTSDAAGRSVAGSVSFTPAADGGRTPSTAEKAQLDALNAGAVLLAASSLDAFGLTLTLSTTGSPAGAQTITIAPAVAAVDWVFTTTGTNLETRGAAAVTPNSSTPTATPPLAGLRMAARDLTAGDTATVLLQFSATATLIGRPYDSVVPVNSATLQATIDLADLGGSSVTALAINFITTTELIFDSTVVDPRQHTYDGLGPLGNDAIVNYNPQDFRLISNDGAFVRELANDSTLQGPASADQRSAVDIIDWSVNTRRLR